MYRLTIKYANHTDNIWHMHTATCANKDPLDFFSQGFKAALVAQGWEAFEFFVSIEEVKDKLPSNVIKFPEKRK